MEKRSNSISSHLKPIPYQAIISFNEIQSLKSKNLQTLSKNVQFFFWLNIYFFSLNLSPSPYISMFKACASENVKSP